LIEINSLVALAYTSYNKYWYYEFVTVSQCKLDPKSRFIFR